jgi:uncharacterized membrane protein
MDSDPPVARTWSRQLTRTLQRIFLSGVLVVVPVTVTVYVLYALFRWVDGLLSPLFLKYLGYSIPGMGLMATVLIVFLIGVVARNVIGSRLVGLGELLFVRTPLVRAIYTAAKQLMQTVTSGDRTTFGRPVMIEFPRLGLYTIGFASAQTRVTENSVETILIAVFVPSTPTPVTGTVVLVPAHQVWDLTMTAEEALKYIVSGGFATPLAMRRSLPKVVEA